MTRVLNRAIRAALILVATLAASSIQAQKKKSGPRVIRLEEIQIEGRVQKPNAFYILNRSSLGDTLQELRTSFLTEIERTVRKPPF